MFLKISSLLLETIKCLSNTIDMHFQRCELCPIKEGALKRTDNQAWAHVICALYIPEVRFGNVTTMEPIILQLVPAERFSKVCVLITLCIYTM